MTRGNQRELARKKNAKKQADVAKAKKNGNVSKEKRMQTDADIMRQKQVANSIKKSDDGAGSSKS